MQRITTSKAQKLSCVPFFMVHLLGEPKKTERTKIFGLQFVNKAQKIDQSIFQIEALIA